MPFDQTIVTRKSQLPAGRSQVKSIPPCTSANSPKCVDEAKTAATEESFDNIMPFDQTTIRRPSRLPGGHAQTVSNAQVLSIPPCTSANSPKCVDEAKTAGGSVIFDELMPFDQTIVTRKS
jgi:hypothetical protein